ncbi:MAG: hypothetical protein FJ315_04715 [SAR202 cluster bacterium]|nr:hypothetical protein [SAR202 cluster bacterium]
MREQNPKRDLELKLRLQLSIMRSKASVLPVDRKGTNTFPDHDLIATPRDPSRWSSHSSNQWVLSGDTAATFIEISTQRFEGNETAVRIPAEDWRYDFAPVLGIGKFMVAELPVLDMASGTFSGADAERVKGAVVALQEMRMELYQGEWNDVIVKARPIAELLRNSIVSDLLKKMNYPPDAIEAFCKSIEGAFDFGSKNIHRTDRSGQLRVPVPADKEDAYLVYSLTVGLMNLLTQKLRKAR